MVQQTSAVLHEYQSDLVTKRLCDALAARVGEALAEERLDRQSRGDVYLDHARETDFARQVSAM